MRAGARVYHKLCTMKITCCNLLFGYPEISETLKGSGKLGQGWGKVANRGAANWGR